MTPDVAVHDAFVLTVDERNRLYERGTVLVEDGLISAVRSSRDDDADVAADTVIDGGVLLRDGEVKTMDADAVCDHVETAVDRFEAETDWELGIGGSESPGSMDIARDLPKRGPAQLLGRLAFQSVEDRFRY